MMRFEKLKSVAPYFSLKIPSFTVISASKLHLSCWECGEYDNAKTIHVSVLQRVGSSVAFADKLQLERITSIITTTNTDFYSTISDNTPHHQSRTQSLIPAWRPPT